MKLDFAALTKKLKVVAIQVANDELIKKSKSMLKDLEKITKAWRKDVQAKLSVQGRLRKNGKRCVDLPPNTSQWPRRCTGRLQSYLWAEAYESKSKQGVYKNKSSFTITIERAFTEFTTNDHRKFNYGKHLNESSKSYGGYRERAYKLLDDKVAAYVARRN